MNPSQNSCDNICLATVTSDSYFQWTMTMLYSFIKNNPWFEGDIVLICMNLPPEMMEDFNFFKRVKFIEPSDELLKQIDLLSEEVPKFKDLAARFFSLEIFRLENYQKVLFLDSDMVVVKSIEEVFKLPGKFYASAQLCFYKGKGRNGFTFNAELQDNRLHDFLQNPVNTGFMLLDCEVLNENYYPALVDSIQPELWRQNNLTYTDELIINQFFKDKLSLLDTRYNYRARAARIIKEKENFTIEDAKIIHFYAGFKPWNFGEVLASSARNLNWIKAYGLWYKWYVEFLKFYHFQKKIAGITNNKTK